MQQLDAGVHDPCVPLVQGEVGVLPRVPAVVVQLQPHDVRPVVPGHRVLPSVKCDPAHLGTLATPQPAHTVHLQPPAGAPAPRQRAL